MNREPVSRRSGVSSEAVAAAARQPGHAREPVSLLEAAGRLWRAAWSLDELRGGRQATRPNGKPDMQAWRRAWGSLTDN